MLSEKVSSFQQTRPSKSFNKNDGIARIEPNDNFRQNRRNEQQAGSIEKWISEEISEKIAFLELIFDNQKKDFSEGFENIKIFI